MTTPNDGGPAFPETRWDDRTRQDVQWRGMSMRQWFAGHVLAGWAAGRNAGGAFESSDPAKVAASCFRYADEMVKIMNDQL